MCEQLHGADGRPDEHGRGGSSVFDGGRPFKDEFHSRLRFNTRGRVAMANEGRKDSNGVNGFVTLGPKDAVAQSKAHDFR